MPTRSIKRKHRDEPEIMTGNWKSVQERAPSVMRGDEPNTARIIALFSLILIAVSGLAMILWQAGNMSMLAVIFGRDWGVFFAMLGTVGLLFHSFVEKDMQYRRLYGLLGIILVGAGVVFRLLPVGGVMGALFLSTGAPALGLGLCFLVAFLRNEEDEQLKDLTLRLMGIAGATLILVGIFVSLMYTGAQALAFVHLLVGFFFVGIYISMQSISSPQGFWAGVALGIVGGLMILIAVGKILFPSVPNETQFFDFVKWQTGQPAAPFMFIYMGVEYVLLSLLTCSDSKLAVLTRRELLTYLYSPIAYIVLIGIAVLGVMTSFIVSLFIWQRSAEGGVLEPIIPLYLGGWLVPFICSIFPVPIITMRLLSEEKRQGTLEVLMTAPVSEIWVVLSKFFAALRFYLLIWYPWAVFLVAVRVEGGQEFDYRPLLVFFIVLIVTASAFVSMGLFFSSLTRNQIAAAILTLVGMVFFTGLYVVKNALVPPTDTFWQSILTYVSFYDLWLEALRGNLAPRFLVFHVSLAVLWLFLTVKVLESRKWK